MTHQERVQKTDAFIREELMKLASFKDNSPRMAEYRIEHSYRVAYIAEEIAQKEGMDADKAFIAALLHDIGYSVDYETKEDYRRHGRVGAKIARPFLQSLGYSEAEVEEMCFAIAVHVDGQADFDGEMTPFAMTIGDADNIDRFDAFRLYEVLARVDYMNLALAEQKAHVDKMLARLAQLRDEECGTKTAERMWHEKIDYQIDFYQRLKKQIEKSK